jgi:hypothetical protein
MSEIPGQSGHVLPTSNSRFVPSTADLHNAPAQAPRPFEDAMDEYQYTRDAQAGAMYEFICEFATLEPPPPPELQQLFRTVHGNQAAMDGFGEYRSDFWRCSQKGTQCGCYC